jgi:hypothetical protein
MAVNYLLLWGGGSSFLQNLVIFPLAHAIYIKNTVTFRLQGLHAKVG